MRLFNNKEHPMIKIVILKRVCCRTKADVAQGGDDIPCAD